MRELVHAAIVFVAWVVAISKSVAVWRQRRWFLDKRVYTSWGFIVFFALSVTFNLETLAFPFDAWAWGNNLSWFVCYASVMAAVYFVATGSLSSLESPPRFLVHLNSGFFLLVALAFLGAVFLIGVAPAPERIDRAIPQTPFELAFVGTMNGYLVVPCLISAFAFAVLCRREEGKLTRFRWGTISISLLVVVAFVLTRLSLACLGYFDLVPPLLRPLAIVQSVLEGIACLLWPVGLLSNRAYLAALHRSTLVKNLSAIWDLRQVQSEFERRCPVVARDVPGLRMFSSRGLWWYRRTDLRLYQMAVSIYDGTRRLSRYLRSEKFSRRLDDVAGAESLYRLLEETSRGASYPEFVEAYRGAARALRAEQRAESGRVLTGV
jgi:hypothetical protein